MKFHQCFVHQDPIEKHTVDEMPTKMCVCEIRKNLLYPMRNFT